MKEEAITEPNDNLLKTFGDMNTAEPKSAVLFEKLQFSNSMEFFMVSALTILFRSIPPPIFSQLLMKLTFRTK